MQKKFLKILLSFAIITILIPTKTSATHLAGAGITYTCVGADSIEVDFVFYRDCSGSYAPDPVIIEFFSISCNSYFTDTMYLSSGTGQQIFFSCQSLPTSCDDTASSYPGIQEYKYSNIVSLPMDCSDWIISWTYCCRSCNITNITVPIPCTAGSSQSMYIYATLDNLNYNCNSSPQFTNAPILFECIGQTVTYSHGSSDPDGDSLVYSLVDPLMNITTPLVFNSGYSATNPVTSVPVLTINQLTGDLTMTPTQLEQDVMAVLVEEYRNGIKIGEVIRDMNVFVRQQPVGLLSIDKNEINIFPNPSDGGFNVSVNTIGKVDISCFDILGNTVFQKGLFVKNIYDQIPIHLQNFESGVYFLRIKSKDGAFLKKLIVY